MKVLSFGFKHGLVQPREGLHVIDCRGMMNPHRSPALRVLTGLADPVVRFVEADPLFPTLLAEGFAAARREVDVAFGCFGGRHRSVVMAEALKTQLEAVGVCVTVDHTSLVID